MSGGGGWGDKQGLLALDPETRFPTHDNEEDMERFIRSFTGREPAGTGVVTPGTWVQFMVERASRDITWRYESRRPYQEKREFMSQTMTVGLGVKDEMAKSPPPKTIRLSHDYFGVLTSQGLYIESKSVPNPPRRARPPIAAKLAMPRTHLVSFF